MPTYVYRCSDCYVQYERVQQISDDADVTCPSCEEPAVRRILQSPALTAAAAPSQMNKVPPPKANPVWERGIKGEQRRDGSFAPYLNAEGKRIGVKEFADNRTKFERILREKKNKST